MSRVPRCRPLREFDVGLREVVALRKQWLSGDLRGCIGEAVAEVQRRRMAPSAEPLPGTDRFLPMRRSELDDNRLQLGKELGSERRSVFVDPRLEDNAGLDE